jgi:acetyltransferase-like isoleucine patch superfamily enzyme
VLHRPLWVAGERWISIGESTLILHSIWLSVETRARTSRDPAIRIGDRVGIRPLVTISESDSITVEDDVVIRAFTTLVDSDHTFADGVPNIMHNPVVTGPIRIGRGTWVGERVAVLRGADIGRCCIIGANSVVRGRIPDYSVAVGAPRGWWARRARAFRYRPEPAGQGPPPPRRL